MYAIMRTYKDNAGGASENADRKHMKGQEKSDEEVFVDSFSYDLCTIAEELKAKQLKSGIADNFIHEKMAELDRKLNKK